MTFDESIAKVGTYLKNNDLSNSDNNDRFFYIIFNELRQEYAPTVEITKKQYHSFKLWKYHTAGWNVTNCAEWARDENITANNAMNAWLHPETIKIVDE